MGYRKARPLRILWEEQIGENALVAVRCGVAHFFHAPLPRRVVHRFDLCVQVSVIEGIQQASPGLDHRRRARPAVTPEWAPLRLQPTTVRSRGLSVDEMSACTIVEDRARRARP